ncbi:MAG: polysaccharide deacetylase family protein [Candidatus Pristimantibacillus sp.]
MKQIFSRSSLLSVKTSLIVMIFLIITACAQSSSPKEVEFVINGKKIDKPPVIAVSKEPIMVPISFLEKNLDAKLEWYLADQGSDNGIYYSDKVAVLMYHDITAVPLEDKSVISVELFKEQMEMLRTNGFQVITLDQYKDFMLNEGKVPDNAVLITFDDGYKSFYTEAFPILQEYNYSAVNFVIVSDVANESTLSKGRPKFSWDDMREMKKAGMYFYSHTNDLHRYGAMREDGMQKPVMTRRQYFKDEKRMETEEEYTARITNDLTTAELKLKEELGNTNGVIAFPYGAYNKEVLEILKSVGIEFSFTVKEGINERGQTNGFRVNGSKAGESAKQLIDKLKALDRVDVDVVLHMNGKDVVFADNQPRKSKDGVLIPLREYCKLNNIKFDQKKNRVSLEF